MTNFESTLSCKVYMYTNIKVPSYARAMISRTIEMPLFKHTQTHTHTHPRTHTRACTHTGVCVYTFGAVRTSHGSSHALVVVVVLMSQRKYIRFGTSHAQHFSPLKLAKDIEHFVVFYSRKMVSKSQVQAKRTDTRCLGARLCYDIYMFTRYLLLHFHTHIDTG